LLRPGDYGTQIRARLLTDGLPTNLVEELLSGGENMREVDECRTEDRHKERELRRILQQGRVDIDEVLTRLDSGGFANKYRRLRWDQPSHTLVAHMARDCSDFVHPEIDRFISVREAARLQSFPDTYAFPGTQFQQLRAIGNAVPPLLAQAVANQVWAFLADRPDSERRSTGTPGHLAPSVPSMRKPSKAHLKLRRAV
jgi:DNA (cytosine-5)-methyltransferase 1